MSKIVIIGGTGFAGTAIAKEAAKRGHTVVSLSRSLPKDRLESVQYVQGSASDKTIRAQVLDGADVVVTAVSPRGDMAGKLSTLYGEIASEAAAADIRLVIVGGFSSLRPAKEQPRFFESGDIPPEYRDEALEVASVFEALKNNGPQNLHWVFISPAATFGSYADVPDFGKYRVSNDVALFDEKGESKISAADFALGVVDEIENPKHNRENISFVQ